MQVSILTYILSFVKIIYLSKSNTLVLISTGITKSYISYVILQCKDLFNLNLVEDFDNIYQTSQLIQQNFIIQHRMDYHNNNKYMETMPIL